MFTTASRASRYDVKNNNTKEKSKMIVFHVGSSRKKESIWKFSCKFLRTTFANRTMITYPFIYHNHEYLQQYLYIFYMRDINIRTTDTTQPTTHHLIYQTLNIFATKKNKKMFGMYCCAIGLCVKASGFLWCQFVAHPAPQFWSNPLMRSSSREEQTKHNSYHAHSVN